MKRWISWLLAAVLLIGCASMGLSVRADAVSAPKEKALVRLSVGGGSGSEQEKEEEQEQEQENAGGGELGRGVVNGSVYENAGLGIGCALDEYWTYYTEEELAEMSGSYDLVEDEELAAQLKSADVVWDMFAVRGDGLAMVGVEYETLGETLAELLDESTYIDLSIENIGEKLDSMGLTDGSMEKITTELAGTERYAIRITGSAMGLMDMYQTQVCIKMGDKIVMILMETIGEDQTEELAKLFYSLDGEPAQPAETEAPAEPAAPAAEPVSFIEAMGSEGVSAYVDAVGVSGLVYQENGKNYYAVEDTSYLYIVCLDDAQLAEMPAQQEYWNRDENAEEPASVHLTGIMETISEEGRAAFTEYFELTDEQYDFYFGPDVLNALPAAEEPAPVEPEPEAPEAKTSGVSIRRGFTWKPQTLVDKDECVFTVTSVDPNGAWGYDVNVECVNKTDANLTFSIDDSSVNGFMIEPYWFLTVEAGATEESTITFYASDLQRSGITDVEEVEFKLTVYNSDDWSAEDIVNDMYAVYPTGLAPKDVVYPGRTVTEDDIVVVDSDDLLFVITQIDADNFWGYTLDYYLENRTDKNLRVFWDDVSVNGYMCDPYWGTGLGAGKRQCAEISFSTSAFELAGITSVDEIEFQMIAYDNDDFLADYLIDETMALYPTDLDADSVVVPERSPEGATVLVDNDMCTFWIESVDPDSDWGCAILCYMENKSDKSLGFTWENVTVNGEKLDPYFSNVVSSGKRCVSETGFSTYRLDDLGIEDISEITFALRIYDSNDWFGDDILNEEFTLNP